MLNEDPVHSPSYTEKSTNEHLKHRHIIKQDILCCPKDVHDKEAQSTIWLLHNGNVLSPSLLSLCAPAVAYHGSIKRYDREYKYKMREFV